MILPQVLICPLMTGDDYTQKHFTAILIRPKSRQSADLVKLTYNGLKSLIARISHCSS